jgi:1-acyl-sn-glycerol-3-phosphate acyltransferase
MAAGRELAPWEHEKEHGAELTAGLHGMATPIPGLTYRLLTLFFRAAAALLGFRVVVEGRDRIPLGPDGRPRGGLIVAGMPHRTWVDPFLPWIVFPARPRFDFFGDAHTMARDPVRRFVMARLGGVIPIPSGHDPKTVETHMAAASAVLASGAQFLLFPETGPASHLGEIRRLGLGIGYMAVRTRAPILPFVLGGNHELFWGRRFVLRILPPLDPLTLAGLDPAAPLPAPGSSAERAAAHAIVSGLAAAVAADVAAVHAEAERLAPPESRRLGRRRLTQLFK